MLNPNKEVRDATISAEPKIRQSTDLQEDQEDCMMCVLTDCHLLPKSGFLLLSIKL